VCSNYVFDAPRTTEPPAQAHFEPLVYVQSTYDIPAILAEIDAATRSLGTGEKTPMVVVGDATWPLSWYLRDYAVHWNALPRQTNAPILIVDPDDAARLQKDLGDRYTAKRFAVRGWWQIEWEHMTPWTLLRFLLERRVWNPTGTTDAVMLLAKDLSPKAALPTVSLREAPPVREYRGTALPAAGHRLGEPGGGPGQFAEPRGLTRSEKTALFWLPTPATTAFRSSRRTARCLRYGVDPPRAAVLGNFASPAASPPVVTVRSTSPIPGIIGSSSSIATGNSSSNGETRIKDSGGRARGRGRTQRHRLRRRHRQQTNSRLRVDGSAALRLRRRRQRAGEN
jgi:hypothetical protein